jgi:hypothetical protein
VLPEPEASGFASSDSRKICEDGADPAGEHTEGMTSEPGGVTYEEAYTVDGLWATPHS